MRLSIYHFCKNQMLLMKPKFTRVNINLLLYVRMFRLLHCFISFFSDEMPYTGDPTEDSRQNSSIHLKCHCLFEKRYLSTLVRFKILFVLYVLCTVAFCLSVILQHLYFVFYMNIENLSYSKSFQKIKIKWRNTDLSVCF